jgi:uncharacterized protein
MFRSGSRINCTEIERPLGGTVKIDPKKIGVGQYQHDVDQKQLAEALKNIVEDAVNSVGVDVNTASPALLPMFQD